MRKPFRHRALTLLELAVVVTILVVLASIVIMKLEGTRDDAQETAARTTMTAVREAFTGSPTAPGFLSDMKPVPEFRRVDIRTHDLLFDSRYPTSFTFDPVTARGWRGPYVSNAQGVANTNKARNGAFPASLEKRFEGDATFLDRGFFYDEGNSHYGESGELTVADPWGNPIVVQIPPQTAFTNSTDAKRFRYARIVSAGADGVLSTPLDRLGGMLSGGNVAARVDDLVIFLNRADTYEDEEP